MQQHTVCPCGACMAIINLSLKFVVHHGPVAEIKVGRFVKPSGPELIVAHRLLKNSIGNSEYLLLTEKLLSSLAMSLRLKWYGLVLLRNIRPLERSTTDLHCSMRPEKCSRTTAAAK